MATIKSIEEKAKAYDEAYKVAENIHRFSSDPAEIKRMEQIFPELAESEDGRLGYCDHTPKRKNGDFGRGYRHWRIDGKVYKTKEKFLAALADFNPSVVPINLQHHQNVVARMKREQEAKPSAIVVGMSETENNEKEKEE